MTKTITIRSIYADLKYWRQPARYWKTKYLNLKKKGGDVGSGGVMGRSTAGFATQQRGDKNG